MRKACRDRFEGISSGACPTCEKLIQVNLGRHVSPGFGTTMAMPRWMVPGLEENITGLYRSHAQSA